MAYQEWAAADYSRLYHTLLDDPKFATVYDDDRRWAWYTRLLIAADSAYPAPAPLPRGLPDDVLATFTELEVLVVLRGSHYRVKALQSEREGRKTGRAAGGHARVAGAQRDEHGRFLAGADAGDAGHAGADAGASKGPATAGPASPAKPSRVRDEKEATRSSTSSARAASGEAALLTKSQLEAWATFGPEWAHFKAAWLERGFRHPPSGDPDGGDTSQRGLLWQVLDARPAGIAEWVRAAPRGATARAVVQYVLDRFHARR